MSVSPVKQEKPFVFKPYTKGELVNYYHISHYVLSKWIKALQPQMGKIIGSTLSIRQVILFAEAYGIPGKVVNNAE